MEGDRRLFARGDQVDEAWRIVQPVLDSPGPVHRYPYGARYPNLSPEESEQAGSHPDDTDEQ